MRAKTRAQLRGWSSYFRYGYPRAVFRRVNHYVQVRFRCFLRNRVNDAVVPFGRMRVCMRVCNAMASAPSDARRALSVSVVHRRVSVSRMLEICMSGSMRGRD
ncbi:MAG: hypothetical protein DMF95_05660 [Acidobacteria bacterium]|nr:MAG: hypothetical protein DMF95_05660 [Acidobacteriota bacterium]